MIRERGREGKRERREGERETGREGERGRERERREKHPSAASCILPDWGLNLQPR